jgi:hypothetical protein
MRILVLGSLIPQTARTVWSLLAAGHEIAELWLGKNSCGAWRRRDWRLKWLAPTWSIEAAVRSWGVHVRHVGPLALAPGTVELGCRPDIDAVLGSCFMYRVPPQMLDYYHGRVCNLHPALLPRYRGPRPMTSMVANEELECSGMSLHVMTPKFDAGAVISQERVAWPADGWYRTWEADLAEAAGRLAAEALPRFLAGSLSATPQCGPATYIRKLPTGSLVLDRRVNERRARWLSGSLGRVMPLSVPTCHGSLEVGPFLETLGPATGDGPVVRWRRIECDVADARIALRRWDHIHRNSERVRELASLAGRPLGSVPRGVRAPNAAPLRRAA